MAVLELLNNEILEIEVLDKEVLPGPSLRRDDVNDSVLEVLLEEKDVVEVMLGENDVLEAMLEEKDAPDFSLSSKRCEVGKCGWEFVENAVVGKLLIAHESSSCFSSSLSPSG